MSGEILVVPKNGQGHLFPCIELCRHLVSRNYKITLITDSDILPSIPPTLSHHQLFHLADVLPEYSPQPHHGHQHQLTQAIDRLLTLRAKDPNLARPVCAVIDHVLAPVHEPFRNFEIPTVTFITSGACWAAMQHGAWKAHLEDLKPGETRMLAGLPEEMALTYSDLKQRRHWLPPEIRTASGKRMGPPFPGEPAPWVSEVQCSVAVLVNTCNDLERPFIDYMSNLTGKPVWGVGPLLPDQYWLPADSLLSQTEIHLRPKRESNFTDDEVIQWLDSKPRASVVFVSFGSEVGPSTEEYPRLAEALEESHRPFIWVIQRKSGRVGLKDSGHEESYFPHGLDSKVGERGLIIHGWAPQLLILSHQSTAGFVSHCGWNSTVEAIVRGVPFIAWPIRGDQYYSAKLLVYHLKVGIMVSSGYPADTVTKNDIIESIERLLTDGEMRARTATLRAKFNHGFPTSSVASLNAFADFVSQCSA